MDSGDKDAELLVLLSKVKRKYWKQNLTILSLLLIIWAAAGFGAGIFFSDSLNQITLPGTYYPLGFWFAHQGAIIIFLLVVLAYCLVMNRLDAEHSKDLEALGKKSQIQASQEQQSPDKARSGSSGKFSSLHSGSGQS